MLELLAEAQKELGEGGDRSRDSRPAGDGSLSGAEASRLRAAVEEGEALALEAAARVEEAEAEIEALKASCAAMECEAAAAPPAALAAGSLCLALCLPAFPPV